MRQYLYLGIAVVVLLAISVTLRMNKGVCPFMPFTQLKKSVSITKPDDKGKLLNESLKLLKARKDREAMVNFEMILFAQPENLKALWGKAEVLRRARNFKESEKILNRILQKDPDSAASLISLSYIRYKDEELDEALKLVKHVLKNKGLDKEDEAMANLMMGTINSRRSKKGWFLDKIIYGTQIKSYFVKAAELAPDLPEAHLGLGSFYLLAPGFAGGNLEEAEKELQIAAAIAPDFATVQARLAQYYLKKNDLGKFDYYLKRAKTLDPDNEVAEELSNDKP